MKYSIDLSRRARRDVDAIYAWIADRSRGGANRWQAALFRTLRGLETSPERKALAPEGRDFERPVRQAFFKTAKGLTYRALFVVEQDRVYVLTIRGPGQPLLTAEELSNAYDD
jgi:plasmid stabilization system protein ParE